MEKIYNLVISKSKLQSLKMEEKYQSINMDS